MAVSTIDALYHSGSEKLTTSATGITVTGTVAATAYTGDGSALTGTGSPSIVDNGNATAMTITSAEKVGVGTSSPSEKFSTVGNVNIGNNDVGNPLNYLRFGATQHGAADIRPSDEGGHKVGLDFYTDGTGDVTINPTFAMRIDGSGHVGIGNTTPSDYYADNLVVNGGNEGGITIVGASTNTNYIMFADGATGNEAYRGYLAYNHPGDYLTLASSGSERIRVDTSGNFLVGKLNGSTASSNTGVVLNPSGTSSINSASDTNMIFARAGTGTMIVFRANNVTTTGTISVSGSSTAYNTSSDYRLKENVVDLTGASARVNQLNPSRFNWIADDTNTLVDGFLAHEVADVVPEAITGTKDAMKDEEYEVTPATGDIYTPATEAYVNDDGNDVDAVDEVIHSADAEQPETLEDGQQWRETTAAVMGTRSVPDYQGIDQSKLVPLLTAALQEALTEIASLKTRVEALEG